jgi:hypothetical protein
MRAGGSNLVEVAATAASERGTAVGNDPIRSRFSPGGRRFIQFRHLEYVDKERVTVEG